jgi:hypothetical protein
MRHAVVNTRNCACSDLGMVMAKLDAVLSDMDTIKMNVQRLQTEAMASDNDADEQAVSRRPSPGLTRQVTFRNHE